MSTNNYTTNKNNHNNKLIVIIITRDVKEAVSRLKNNDDDLGREEGCNCMQQ